MNRKNNIPFCSALVVSPSRDHLHLDREFLKSAGIQRVYCAANAKRALAWLTANPVDLVLLDTDLGSAKGTEATALLRKRRSLDRTPIVLTSLRGEKADVLEAMAAGCSGFLLRPFSMETFLRQMHLAANGITPAAARQKALERGRREAGRNRHEQSRKALETVVSPANEARRRYQAGCIHLADQRFEQAIQEFSKALAVNSLYAEAYVGLAKAYKELGDPKRARQNMRRAASAYTLRDEMERTRQALALILRDNPNTENPFLELGFNLVRQGDLRAAGQAYDLATRYAGPGLVNAAAARACYFTRDPMGTAKRLAETMAESSGAHNAPALFKGIMGDIPRLPNRHATGTSAAQSQEPNLMRDTWAVLKYTYKTFRNGGPLPAGTPIALDF